MKSEMKKKRSQIFSFPMECAILTAAEMMAAEQATYNSGVAAFTLMTRAGKGLAQAIMKRSKPGRVLFLIGPGNNGGDGWVAAELLRRKNYSVLCATLAEPGRHACAATMAFEKYQGDIDGFPKSLKGLDVIVDCLFGTGLVRAIEGTAAQWIAAANKARALKVACDIPSGISSDTGQILGTAFCADVTVTFSHKKRGHVLMPGLEHAGEVVVVDIGITKKAVGTVCPKTFENNLVLWKRALPWLEKSAYKHKRGHLLVIGGLAAMSGAARMAARSALRTGAGLVTTCAPEEAIAVYAEKQLAVMSVGYDSQKAFENIVLSKKFNAFVIGPGNGVGQATCTRVQTVLATGSPVVLDADAITSFEGTTESLLKVLHGKCVLTPHIGEFKRLWPELKPDVDKITATQTAAKQAGCVVLLKGPDTVIAAPDGGVIVNIHGDPHLATAGAGDVLAGIIGGLLAQGMPLFLATAAAVWIHGDAALKLGPGLIAEDLIEQLPGVLKDLYE